MTNHHMLTAVSNKRLLDGVLECKRKFGTSLFLILYELLLALHRKHREVISYLCFFAFGCWCPLPLPPTYSPERNPCFLMSSDGFAAIAMIHGPSFPMLFWVLVLCVVAMFFLSIVTVSIHLVLDYCWLQLME